MSRPPGLGVAQSVVALVFLAAVVVVGAASLGLVGNGPGGASPSPTAITAEPTPTASADATPPRTPGTTSTPTLKGDVVVYTNPDGISPEGFAGDDYPFIEQARALPTFAGLWGDENQRDVHVAVTRDIPGAIATLKDGIPRGITVYFHLAPYTEAEICGLRDRIFDDRDELMRHGIVLTSGGCSNMEMRVNIGMSPFTPESVAYMEARYQGPVDYEASGGSALRPYDPPEGLETRLEAVLQGNGFDWLTCGRRPFPENAVASGPVDIAMEGPMFAALRESLTIYVDLYGDLSTLPWILAEQDDYGATFLAHQGERWLEAPVFAGTQEWVPGTVDDCSPREFTSGDYRPAEWSINRDFPAPTRESTELHILVNERGCASGRPPIGRVVPPVVTYSSNTVHLAIGVRNVGGMATCPGAPSLPVTVVLPEPLGNRELTGDTAPRF